MMANIMYYQKFKKILELEGYEFNIYKPCVAKNIIKNNQMTICFHAKKCKLSHKIPKVVGGGIEWLRQEYESIFKDGSGAMSVRRGKIHQYIDMTLDYTVSGISIISIREYIDKMLNLFDKKDPSNRGNKSCVS